MQERELSSTKRRNIVGLVEGEGLITEYTTRQVFLGGLIMGGGANGGGIEYGAGMRESGSDGSIHAEIPEGSPGGFREKRTLDVGIDIRALQRDLSQMNREFGLDMDSPMGYEPPSEEASPAPIRTRGSNFAGDLPAPGTPHESPAHQAEEESPSNSDEDDFEVLGLGAGASKRTRGRRALSNQLNQAALSEEAEVAECEPSPIQKSIHWDKPAIRSNPTFEPSSGTQGGQNRTNLFAGSTDATDGSSSDQYLRGSSSSISDSLSGSSNSIIGRPLLDPQQARHAEERAQRALAEQLLRAPRGEERLGPSASIEDRKAHLMTPGGRDQMVQCIVRRKKSPLGPYPVFAMYDHKGQFMLSARRRKKSRNSNFLVSLDPFELSRDAHSYFGKLRSNFMGSEYTLYTAGARPGRAGVEEEGAREELGIVKYRTTSIAGGPRKMTIALPMLEKGKECEGLSIANMYSTQKHGGQRRVHVLRSKEAEWSKELGGYTLDFKGRVKEASVKNFVLTSDLDEHGDTGKVSMIFGRTNDNEFVLDYSWPLSPMQAFQIALSSLDDKLAFAF